MEDVEKKIELMQKANSAKYDYSEAIGVTSARDSQRAGGSNVRSSKVTKGLSHQRAPSLDMIRKEVKAALSKVSSSVDLG